MNTLPHVCCVQPPPHAPTAQPKLKTKEGILNDLKSAVEEMAGTEMSDVGEALQFLGVNTLGTSQEVHAPETALNIPSVSHVRFLYPGQAPPPAERAMEDILTDVKAGVKDLTGEDVRSIDNALEQLGLAVKGTLKEKIYAAAKELSLTGIDAPIVTVRNPACALSSQQLFPSVLIDIQFTPPLHGSNRVYTHLTYRKPIVRKQQSRLRRKRRVRKSKNLGVFRNNSWVRRVWLISLRLSAATVFPRLLTESV